MNLSRWKKGIAMDSYEAFRNKKIQSDDEFIRGPRKSKSASTISSISNLNIRIAYIVMIQFRSTDF